MSEAAIIAVVSIIATFLIAIAGQVKDYVVRQQDIDARREERQEEASEWYRRALFEKRLSALNQAYAYLFRLNRLRAFARGDAERQEQLRVMAVDAREWLDANILMVYDSPPKASDYIGALNSATDLDSPNFETNMDGALADIRSRSSELLNSEKEPE